MTSENGVSTLPDGVKICSVCGEQKLLSEFHFQRYAPRAGERPSEAPRGRYRSNCKKCQREYMKERRVELIKEQGAAYLEAETKRVRRYYDDKENLDLRRAVDRARYSAYAALRERHPAEYEELLIEAKAQEGVPHDPR